MKRHSSIVLGFLLGVASMTHAEPVPQLVNYQGRLTDAAGQPLTNGTYAVQFRLWNRALTNQPGEALVWGRQYDLTLVNGVFNVILGASGGSALPGAAVNDLQFAFGDSERYLGLTLVRLHDGTVISEAQRKEILPRQQLLSAPFAFMAGGLVKELADALSPPGSITAFGGSADAVPDGWILCDGRPLPIASYQRLHTAIRFAWGDPGNGQFRVPDLRGMFLRGVDDSPVTGASGRDPDRGDSGRSQIHNGANFGNRVGSWQTDALRAHTHTMGVNGTDTFSMAAGGATQRLAHFSNDAFGAGPKKVTDGPNSPGNESRPINAYVNYIIKD